MADLVNTCPSCGAEESLDVMFSRMVDDDIVRRAIHDVVIKSLPLGAMLLRHIRLHKPPKQRLRMTRLRELLSELAGDMARNVIERHGRTWAVTNDDWRGAFEAVFAAVEKGTLQLPLQGNGYLYQVLSRKSDQVEAAQEAKREEDARLRPRRDTVQVRGQALEIGAALDVVYGGKDPALAAIDQSKRNAAPIPAHLRERMQQIKKGQP
jgi:hypothetical protein